MDKYNVCITVERENMGNYNVSFYNAPAAEVSDFLAKFETPVPTMATLISQANLGYTRLEVNKNGITAIVIKHN